MPLIILTGIPCSGKSRRAEEMKGYFEKQDKEVYIVSEYNELIKANFQKNNVYKDASKEKHIRGSLKSEVVRLTSPKNVVILDALNYIKGYRYELYCAMKSNKCTQCVVHTEINREEAWKYNENRPESEKYDRDIFDALVMRYEEPDPKNRWDSPYFIVFPNDQLDLQAISDCLFKKKPPPPNQSTQNPPLSATNYLYELDRVTKEITDDIIQKKKLQPEGEVRISGYNDLSIDITNVNPMKLMILRRQYITYSKMHMPEIYNIPQLYIQYLKASLK